MTYTLANIPDELDRALRERAAAQRKSLDATIIELLSCSVGIRPQEPSESANCRDLSDIAGTWEEDPETEAILEEQNRIDLEMWK